MILLASLGVSFFAAQVVAVSVGGTLAWVATLAALAAFVVTIRADGAWSAGMAGLLVAVAGWFQLADIGYAALFVTVPGGLYRGAVVVCVGVGRGVGRLRLRCHPPQAASGGSCALRTG